MGMHGKHHTEETKAKIAKALYGRKRPGWKLSAETRKRQSDARKGIHLSAETKEKLRLINIGKKLSKETRDKMGRSRSGCKNPAWNGGSSFAPYCSKFNERFKKLVKEFYGNKCAICGSTGRIHIHHVDYNKQTCCDGSLPRFIALCNVCHGKTNHNREYWREILGSEFRLFVPQRAA